MRQAPPAPEGMVSLGDLLHHADPTGARTNQLGKRIWRMVEDKHPVIQIAAVTNVLMYVLEDAPPEMRVMLARQLGDIITMRAKDSLQ